MKLKREDFLASLEAVKAGLSPREFIEQSSCFVFQDGYVMTFNDEVACRKKINLSIRGAIQAASLLEILGRITDTELKVRENDKGELEFLGKRKRFGITKDAEVFLPIDRVEQPDKWTDLGKDFTQAVGLVQHCVSTDESRFLFTCIHIHPDYLEACDNFQIMRFKINTGVKKSILVRGSSLAHIITMGMSSMSITKSWIHFKNPDGLQFSCRLYHEEYPDLSGMLKVKGSDINIPKGLKETAERAEVFAVNKSGDPLIDVMLNEEQIEICGQGLSGWYRERKSVAYTGPALHFVIAPLLLKYVADHYQEAVISPGRLKVTGGDSGRWQYVTQLGDPNEKPAAEAEEDDGKDES